MNAINWFEIPVTDLNRATEFYQQVFNVEISPMEMGDGKMGFFPWEQGETGSSGCLIQSEGYTPSHTGTIVYFSVASIEDTLGNIDSAGGKTLLEKMSIGEHGHIAHFEDCEGNRVALHQAPSAN